MQAKMREGKGTESRFLHAPPCQSCLALTLALMGQSFATAAGDDLAPFPGCLAGSVAVLSSLPGQGSPQTGCSSTSGALVTLEKPWE